MLCFPPTILSHQMHCEGFMRLCFHTRARTLSFYVELGGYVLKKDDLKIWKKKKKNNNYLVFYSYSP